MERDNRKDFLSDLIEKLRKLKEEEKQIDSELEIYRGAVWGSISER